MAPEIFKKAGHGKAVDIWAIGVITYFLLCGYTPFDRDSQYEEMQAICNGDYKFEPVTLPSFTMKGDANVSRRSTGQAYPTPLESLFELA